MFLTVIVFIAILSVLVLVHEFGHFWVAKKSGAKVEEFGIGFPPRILGIKRGETVYSINLFPIGGFVKIYGEDGSPDGSTEDDHRSFSSKTIGTRSLIIAAGVLMNILLAVVVLSFGHFIGLPQVISEKETPSGAQNISVRIADIAENSPAELAGIKRLDVIVAMKSGEESISGVKNISGVQDFTESHLAETITVSIKRGEEILEKKVIPRENPPEGEGAMGIAMVRTGEISQPFYLAPLKGLESTFFMTLGTLRAFAGIFTKLITTGAFGGDLAGPVGIAVLTGQMQKMGFVFLLQFIALISINLAIINSVPFPALDGGRLLFLAVEKIKGSPVKQKYEKMAHTVGFALLILLMIAITFRDLGRFL